MHYRLTCPCGVAHAVSTSQAGQQIRCTCGNTLPVPTLRGLKELPTMEPPATASPARMQSVLTRGSRIQLGILFLVIALAVPAAIFFAYQRLHMDTSLTREALQQEVSKRLDAARPQDLTKEWESYSTTPLGQPQKPDFYRVERAVRTLDWSIGITCGVALLAAIAAASIVVANREASDSRPPSQTHAGA